MLKVQRKVFGCFRSDSGAAAFARLRGYHSTLRKQGHALLTALETSSPVSRSIQPLPEQVRTNGNREDL
jgi:hypothetical protein